MRRRGLYDEAIFGWFVASLFDIPRRQRGDSANAIAVDAAGQVYVAGQTLSSDFPLASPLQAVTGGKSEAFISKIMSDGSGLVYSTFLGGSGDDVATSIAVDRRGNAFVSGYTDSANFPTHSPLQAACQKGSTGACSQDAFLAVVNSSGSGLKFSTYLGFKIPCP